MIYTIKTIVGRENIVMSNIGDRARNESLKVQALVHPEEIKGYVFVEGELKDIEQATQMISHIRGLIKRPIQLSEIQRFLQPKIVEISLERGDVVEVVGGPFKGEKGKVTKYDKVKREVTIELLEVAVPIPITVSAELLKVLEKGQE